MTDLFRPEKTRTDILLQQEVWRTTKLFLVENLAVIQMIAPSERLQFRQSLRDQLLISSVLTKEVCWR